MNERDLKRAIRAYLSAGPPDEIVTLVEQLEMELASPGEWEAAKYAPDPEPDPETTPDTE